MDFKLLFPSIPLQSSVGGITIRFHHILFTLLQTFMEVFQVTKDATLIAGMEMCHDFACERGLPKAKMPNASWVPSLSTHIQTMTSTSGMTKVKKPIHHLIPHAREVPSYCSLLHQMKDVEGMRYGRVECLILLAPFTCHECDGVIGSNFNSIHRRGEVLSDEVTPPFSLVSPHEGEPPHWLLYTPSS